MLITPMRRDRGLKRREASREPEFSSRTVKTGNDRLQVFHQHRALLFSIAYRMLGSVADAEDMLQETFIRWQQSRDIEV